MLHMPKFMCRHDLEVLSASKERENFSETWMGKTFRKLPRVRYHAKLKCRKCSKEITVSLHKDMIKRDMLALIEEFLSKQ
jgi:hypothetical protein